MKRRRTSAGIVCGAVAFSAAILIVVGCQNKQGSTPVSATASKPKLSTEPTGNRPFANWPDNLAGTLIISGEMVGYTEPCGCTEGQKGGLIRRMALVDLIRTERKWPVALIDLGSIINDPNGHGGQDETKIRFVTALKAFALLNYNAIGLSADDMKIGAGEMMMNFVNNLAETPDAPKIVAANVKLLSDLFEKRIRPSIITSVGPIRIGVTSVLDPTAFNELRDQEKDAFMAIQSPESVLPGVLAGWEDKVDLRVLMVQGPPELAKVLAKKFPQFEIVVRTSETVDPPDKPESTNDGKTWLVEVGKKGQYVGVIGLPKDPSKPRLYQRMMLGPPFDKYKSRAEAMRKLIDEDFVADLKSGDVLSRYVKRPYTFGANPVSDVTYVGAETCAKCHPNTYQKWLGTKHAKAYEGLIKPKRNREADAECIRCHTTGFEFLGGFATADKTPNLKGNQCENCHGPGSAHSAFPDDKEILKTVARSKEDFNKNRGCIDCHDEDNSPHFDFEKHYPQIMHEKLDSYTDPKVHQGIKK